VLNAAAAGAAFNTDLNKRQLHPTEKQRIREMADGKARASCRGDSACERDARLYWSDMLERVAESRVDAQADADEQAYRQSVIDAAHRAGTEASMGGAERYFGDLDEARRMLDADTGRVILDRQGRVVLWAATASPRPPSVPRRRSATTRTATSSRVVHPATRSR
jgi:hypothetical protein